MNFKNYYLIIVLCLIGYIGFAQTPDHILVDPSNKTKMKYEKITSKKNKKAELGGYSYVQESIAVTNA